MLNSKIYKHLKQLNKNNNNKKKKKTVKNGQKT